MAHVPGYTFLRLDEATADATAFGQRADRAGGAIGTAAAIHALIVLSVWGLPRVPPGQRSAQPVPLSSIAPFVFTASGGDQNSGGHSGGGNRSARAARLLTHGPDVMSVPAVSPRALTTPETIVPEREATPTFEVPVQPMSAGELQQVGAVDGVPGLPDERGPGDRGAGSRPDSERGLGDGPRSGIGEGPYPIGNGVTAPQLLFQTRPQYTADAMRAKIQGIAVLSGVVGPDGTLRDIRVVRSLDGTFGLDREAIACVRQWKFRPGQRQGKPVAVYVTIEVAFNLR